MKIRPLYDRVVIKRVEEKGDALRGGPVHSRFRQRETPRGEVMAIGKGQTPGRWSSMVTLDVQVGDRILFGKYSGSDITIEGTDYMIMREDEILAVLDKQAAPADRHDKQPAAADRLRQAAERLRTNMMYAAGMAAKKAS